jgi:hypothetical protein
MIIFSGISPPPPPPPSQKVVCTVGTVTWWCAQSAESCILKILNILNNAQFIRRNISGPWMGMTRTTTPLPPPPLRGKIFQHEYVVIAFQRLYFNFSYQISVLCPKKQISCTFRGNISPRKWLGPNKIFLGALRTWGPLPPLSAALMTRCTY